MALGRLLLLVLFLNIIYSLEIPFADDDDNRFHPNFIHDRASNGHINTLTVEEADGNYWRQQAQDRLSKKRNIAKNLNKAKNIIFFLGDGMSIATLSTARVYAGQKAGLDKGEEFELNFEKFPVTGLTKTYCLDRQVPDSACTATAFLGGVKSLYGTIGVDGQVNRRNCERSLDPETHVESIAKWAIDAGKSSGIVTTTRVTHASPAGAYAHVANRGWESDTEIIGDGFDPDVCLDITHQLIHGDTGKNFKVILGGGRRTFRPYEVRDEEGSRGTRSDGRDLIEEWKQQKADAGVNHSYVWNKEQLNNIDEGTEYLLGLFGSTHMSYNLEANLEIEPTLVDMTESAINILSKNTEGYFLFVEGGRIDHAHHATTVQLSLDETKIFSEAIGKAVEMMNSEDTLIIVTSDHSHVMTHNGYPKRGVDVLGPSGELGSDDIPYTVVTYANGPGYRKEEGGRVDVTIEDMKNPRFRYPAAVPLSSESHAGDDIAVFAYGPHQHIFSGMYEQNLIPHLLGYASCLGPGTTLCNNVEISNQSQSVVITVLFSYSVFLAIERLFL